ncbi:hypothetical protein [Cerasicoccus arenae]|uniref:Uncharacterized protein n=1 Tax=Cerasicoccus arenae TaxID=424488 RepID=A0A8J3DEI9_9BACT|nr:hypothetical protein [Cerasicoccus arenae]MBK1859515.1 hypothetical protein [Cerasicoccus arenae]GHB97067.1 hypothetical protein GCM10007047_11320 [Cerasicoccus arenae]
MVKRLVKILLALLIGGSVPILIILADDIFRYQNESTDWPYPVLIYQKVEGIEYLRNDRYDSDAALDFYWDELTSSKAFDLQVRSFLQTPQELMNSSRFYLSEYISHYGYNLEDGNLYFCMQADRNPEDRLFAEFNAGKRAITEELAKKGLNASFAGEPKMIEKDRFDVWDIKRALAGSVISVLGVLAGVSTYFLLNKFWLKPRA